MKTIITLLSTLILVSCVSEVPTMEQLSGQMVSASSRAYVYRLNQNLASISIGSIDLSNGVITELLPESLSEASSGTDLVLHPSKKYLYVVDSGVDKIMIYSTNMLTGALHYVDFADTDSSPKKAVIHPTGNFFYLFHSGGKIEIFRIDLSTGKLYPNGDAQAYTGEARTISINPSGTKLYANNDKMTIFDINTSSGQLGTSSSFSSPQFNQIVFHPSNSKIFAATTGYDPIKVYNGSGGFSFLEPATMGMYTSYKNLMLSADAKMAYALEGMGKNIETYRINELGVFTSLRTMKLPNYCMPKGLDIVKTAPIIVVSCSENVGETYTYLLDANGEILTNSVNMTSVAEANIVDQIILDSSSAEVHRPLGTY